MKSVAHNFYKTTLVFVFFALCFSGKAQESYSLDRLVGELLESNYGIKILRNEAVIAANNNNIGNAGYLPDINIIADRYWSSYNTRQEFFSGQVNEAKAAKSNSTNAAIQLNWTFFDGFRMFAIDKRLDLQESVATMNLSAEMEMKIYQAAIQFYTLIQFQQLDSVYRESIELSKARYDQQVLMNDLGAASEVQLVQARLDLFADSSVYLNNLNEIQKTKATINYLLGKDQSVQFEAEGDLSQWEMIDWSSLLNSAREQNTSILINKANIAIRDQEQKEIRSYYYPQVSFYTQYVYSQSQNQVGILNSSRTFGPGVGLTLTWNILSDLSTYTNLKNAKLYSENAEVELQDQELYIESELRKSYSDYEWSVRNLNLEQQNISEVGVNFEIAETAYLNGALTNLELREFQFSIIQAQTRYLQAQLQHKTAELNLRLLTGDFKRLL